MKPSELLELCMELNSKDFNCSMDFVGSVFGVYFSLRYQTDGKCKSVYFQHPDNQGSLFFAEPQIQDATDWLRKQHEEFRSKQ